ncbi:EAL domain-containing protein [Sporomusa sp. KB1]|jgi:diguanylate cyclase (GGDEF)-like protein|uniref:EAL domain-containing protein n=1 Tax=Sporomusa sp. KB1 TaxID=943346 RepID=UPI0011A4A8F1|nr:EAL domain-containing protein [Sporomusa sp. KB1]TWH48361.1 diguanylate cyclase (GGDEF)-like protein [Sporomusa sp. KB1]
MKNLTLKHQFKRWTVLLVVVPSLLIMAIYTIGQIQLAKQNNLELISQRVDFQQRLIEYWVEERANDVRKISQLEPFRNADVEQMGNILSLMQRNSTDFDSLSYIDKDSYFRLSTLAGGIHHISTAGQPYFQAAALGKEYISDVVIGRNSGLPIINFSSPVYDNTGSFQGLILGSVRTTTLEVLLRDNWMGKTGEIILVNNEGTMLAEPRYVNVLIDKGLIDKSSKMKTKLSPQAMQKIHLGGTGSASWVDYLGNKVLGAYQFIPERGWTLIGSISEDEILIPIYTQVGVMAGGTILLVLFLLPLATLFTNRIKRPIDWLIGQSNLVMGENYEMLSRAEGLSEMPYELSNLCKAFVKMSQKIENTVGILKQNEAELESIVRERTSQLQEMNTALEEEIMERQLAQEALSRKSAEIEKMVYSDALTGLSNRVYLDNRLEEEINKARLTNEPGAILFIDLDDLKMINDTFGHKCGDDIIILSGKRIVKAAGNSAVVGRIGGDEFIVLLPGKHERCSITEIAASILEAFSQDIEIADNLFRVSASIGIAMYPADGDTSEEVFKNADSALYEAKRAGKNCLRFYEEEMQAEIYEKMMLTNSLRQAIERGELFLNYQPQVSITTGNIMGFEALLRWKSSEYGLISPLRFIPLAEQSGLIHPIGQWVLRKACQFARQLAENGWNKIYIAVNISAKQLAVSDFISIVRSTLEEVGVEPYQLELEITESILMASIEDSIGKLKELQDMGVRLVLDDFGTGYSSLTYLRSLPVETLKIDKSFIDKLAIDEVSAKIICSIIEMAHILDKSVIAEGVEIKQQLDYLSDISCDIIQGYLFSRPVPEEEVIPLLAAGFSVRDRSKAQE